MTQTNSFGVYVANSTDFFFLSFFFDIKDYKFSNSLYSKKIFLEN